ncbi:MAG: hypothetical protein AAFO75_11740, partial [Pseudomonadota bacterium]
MPDIIALFNAIDWDQFGQIIMDYRLVLETIAIAVAALLIGYVLGRRRSVTRDSFQTELLAAREKYWRRRLSSSRKTSERQVSEKTRKQRALDRHLRGVGAT